MKLAIEIVHEIADFYHTCIEIQIFDCHSSEELEELMISELDSYYDYDIDVDSLEDLAFQASMEYIGGDRYDTDWLQEAIIRTQQLEFLKDLVRIIYDNDIIFSEKDLEDEDDYWN
jgi:hypothetical protein